MIVKELAVVVRTYTDKNGELKKAWKNIGAIHEHEGRQYITLDSLVNLAAIPRKEGEDRVYVSMFEPKAKQAADKAGVPPKQASGFDDDSIPF